MPGRRSRPSRALRDSRAVSGPINTARTLLKSPHAARASRSGSTARRTGVYLWTATYAATEDARHHPRLVRQDVRYLFRRLRADLGRAFPYLWTTEWHSTGHGLHVHLAVGERVDIATVRSAWRRGHVWVSPPSRDGRGQVEHARRVARYVAKYLAKDHRTLDGLHRYEVAQGFQPRSRMLVAATAEAAVLVAAREMGAAPVRYWESRQAVEWAGPPAIWAAWE